MYISQNLLTDYSPQMEVGKWELFEPRTSVFTETEEIELTSELMEVSNEEELDHFLGDLISKAGKAVGKFVKSPIGKAVGGVLKGVVKYGLPIAGNAVGTIFGGPIGGMVGGGLASTVTNVLGLELEGLSPEDREFETARQFVRFAGETLKNALQAHPNADPEIVAPAAAGEAAHVYAPALLSSGPQRGASTGNWVRHGSNIVLLGL